MNNALLKPYFRLDPVPGSTMSALVVVDDDGVSAPIVRFESSWTGAAIRDALNLHGSAQRAGIARRLFPVLDNRTTE